MPLASTLIAVILQTMLTLFALIMASEIFKFLRVLLNALFSDIGWIILPVFILVALVSLFAVVAYCAVSALLIFFGARAQVMFSQLPPRSHLIAAFAVSNVLGLLLVVDKSGDFQEFPETLLLGSILGGVVNGYIFYWFAYSILKSRKKDV